MSLPSTKTVMVDDQLTFSDHTALLLFALFNITKRRPFLTWPLVWAMWLLQWPNRCAEVCGKATSDDPEWHVFNQLKRAYITPLLIEVHWLPVPTYKVFLLRILHYKMPKFEQVFDPNENWLLKLYGSIVRHNISVTKLPCCGQNARQDQWKKLARKTRLNLKLESGYEA